MQANKAIIIDDESAARNTLAGLLSKYAGISLVDEAANANTALKKILQHQPDIIFLDIDMPGKNGFDLINLLKEYHINPTIVFVTAFNEYAIKAIKCAAFDYIVKPVIPEELDKCIYRFMNSEPDTSLKQQLSKLTRYLTPESVRFNTRTGYTMIDLRNIVYCKADGNYTHIYLDSGKTEYISQQIGKIEKQQLNKEDFLRISRSVIVNKKFVCSFDRSTKKIKLINTLEEIDFKVSRSALKEIN